MDNEISIKVGLDTRQFDADLRNLEKRMARIRPCCFWCRLLASIRFFFMLKR